MSEEIASREQLLIEKRLEAVQAVNELVAEGEVDEIFKALQNPYLEVGELEEAFSTRYSSLLQSHLECYEGTCILFYVFNYFSSKKLIFI